MRKRVTDGTKTGTVVGHREGLPLILWDGAPHPVVFTEPQNLTVVN